ncbi:MAG: ferritin [Bacteroidota bacterium]|jgi:ferritin
MENFSSFRSSKSKKPADSGVNESFHSIGMSSTVLPIKPKKLLPEVEQLLNERLGDEYTAYFFYRNAANWCKNANYKKAADFFNKEAEGELGHAKGLQDYITQWNALPVIPQVHTTINFSGLVDIINKAYMIEETLLNAYSENQKFLVSLDPATFNFIQQYVDIQNGEVEEYSDYLNALELVNPSNPFELLFFEQTYF